MAPGDKVTYTVDLVNKGTINAKIDNIEKTVLTSEQQRYLTFKVTDKNGKEVSEGDILSAGETKKLTITIEFIKDLTKEDLPKQTITISLSYKLNFVQTDDKVTSGSQGGNDKTYAVGDEFCLENECFYVIKDNGTTVTALAKYGLLVGNTAVYNDDFSDMTVTSISTSEEGYGLQNSIAGYVPFDSEGYPLSHTIKGAIAFSESCYWEDDNKHKPLSQYGTDYPTNVFDSNSLLYEPVQNYKNYLKNTLGKTSVDARLITYEELISLGCDDNGGSETNCKSAPSWVYSNVIYWTAIASNDYRIWSVVPSADISICGYDNAGATGLRPVITISKSDI